MYQQVPGYSLTAC